MSHRRLSIFTFLLFVAMAFATPAAAHANEGDTELTQEQSKSVIMSEQGALDTDDIQVVSAQDALESGVDATQGTEATQDVEATGSVLGVASEETDEDATEAASVTYRSYVGGSWQAWRNDAATSGSAKKSKTLRAIKVKVANTTLSGGVQYRACVQNKGWQKWVRNGSKAGTTSKKLGLQAVRVKLYGELASAYDVWYRVHSQKYGWMAWTTGGKIAGTPGLSLRVNGMQIALVAKGQEPTDLPASDSSYSYVGKLKASVRAYQHAKGWTKSAGQGETVGSTSNAEGLDALKIKVSCSGVSGGVAYRVRYQKKGWTAWKKDGAVAGKKGSSRRVEAVKIKLTGELATMYDVYYRTYVQNVGWMSWTKNGAASGSIGVSLRARALQIRLVEKGTAASLPSGSYKGKLINAKAKKPSNLEVKIVHQLEHGYKSPYYQRCIVMHDTTEYRSFDYWISAWIKRGGSGTQFMVKEDGSIRQYASMNQICWHAGGATYPWIDTKYNVVKHLSGAGSAMNQCSIGIEIDHVIDGRGYPEAQLDALDELVAYIDAYYGFESTILQHKDYHLSNGDCSAQFQGYLKHLQKYRTTR